MAQGSQAIAECIKRRRKWPNKQDNWGSILCLGISFAPAGRDVMRVAGQITPGGLLVPVISITPYYYSTLLLHPLLILRASITKPPAPTFQDRASDS